MDELQVRVASEVFLVEVVDVGEGCFEQFVFVAGEIVLRFDFQHFQAIEHRLGSAQVEGFFSRYRMRNLAEEEPRVLRLQKEEVVETRIGLWVMRHGRGQ